MARPKNDTKQREDFMLSGKLSELEWEPRSEEQISKDLFKYSDPEKMIDAFERQLGLDSKTVKTAKVAYKCVFLSPCSDDDDRQLLQKFYNSPERYQVINRSDNWTPKGELKIFLEYTENLDVREEQEQQTQTEQP